MTNVKEWTNGRGVETESWDHFGMVESSESNLR